MVSLKAGVHFIYKYTLNLGWIIFATLTLPTGDHGGDTFRDTYLKTHIYDYTSDDTHMKTHISEMHI